MRTRRGDPGRRRGADRHLLAGTRRLPAGLASVSVLDSFRLEGRVALVTGASRGLGAGMALALASAGADIALHSSSAPASATADAIDRASGRRTTAVTGDLADAFAAQRIAHAPPSAFPRGAPL